MFAFSTRNQVTPLSEKSFSQIYWKWRSDKGNLDVEILNHSGGRFDEGSIRIFRDREAYCRDLEAHYEKEPHEGSKSDWETQLLEIKNMYVVFDSYVLEEQSPLTGSPILYPVDLDDDGYDEVLIYQPSEVTRANTIKPVNRGQSCA